MKYLTHILFLITLIGLIGLTACGATPTAEPTATATVAPTATPQPEPTATTPAEPTAVPPADTAEQAPSSGPAVCRTESITDMLNLSKFPELAPVTDTDWTHGGSADSKITVIEYADFQCPGCSGTAPLLDELQYQYGDDLRLVYRHFPLTGIHDKAFLSAVAAEAAGEQGDFWNYHNILFNKQDEWAGLSVDEARQKFIDYATEAKLDVKQFTTDLDAKAIGERVINAEQAAIAAGLGGTPTILVNGYFFPTQQLPLSREGIHFFMNLIRLVEMQYDTPAQVVDAAKKYQATITTKKGDIVIDLLPELAPVNVNSVAFLAQQGWYDNTTFHRVLPDFMAQGGDPSGLGIGWPGYRCDDEIAPDNVFDKAGLVAMANSGANTNGAQFFITYGPAEHLNGKFTIIGQVVSGQEVVEALTPRDPDEKPDFEGDTILKMTVTEKP